MSENGSPGTVYWQTPWPETERVVMGLRRRAARAEGAARLALWTIVCLLCGGGLLLWYADQLVEQRASTVASLRGKIGQIHSNLQTMVALSTDRINFDDMREAAARDAVEKVAADLPRLSEALKESSEALGLYANKVSAGDVGADWGLITAATLTRVSTMLVLIFVTQILVGVHRYNSKLGVFLHTRADALELAAGIQREEFAILIERLAPTNLEFERVPKAPMDQVVALARELAGVMRKP